MRKKQFLPLLLLLLLSLVACGPAHEATELPVDAAAYASAHWPRYEVSYDPAAQVLSLTQKAEISYANACAFGGNVYTQELAPESFLTEVRAIAADVATNCKIPALTVSLSYLSTDGIPIFTVCSDGSVSSCWEGSGE